MLYVNHVTLNWKSIDLCWCEIDDMRMEELCNIVPLIKYVNLSYNKKIGVAGYIRLFETIRLST